MFYDDDCGVCRWLLVRLLGWDRAHRLEPVPLDDPRADRWLGHMSREQRMASWHLVTPERRLLSGGDAVPHLMRLLPAGAPLGLLTAAAGPLTNAAYALVAANRVTLGRLLGEGARERTRRQIAEHRRRPAAP